MSLWVIVWNQNNAIDIGRWSICGDGRLERFYCINYCRYAYSQSCIVGVATILRVPNHTTNKPTRAPIYKGSVTWNDLPTKTREASLVLAFEN